MVSAGAVASGVMPPAADDSAPTPSAFAALRAAPLRYLFTSWPWRSLGYLLTGVLVGPIWLILGVLLAFLGVVFTPVGGGLVLLALFVVLGIPAAALERRRLSWIDAEPLASAHLPAPRQGILDWWRLRLREPATWRELAAGLPAVTLLWLFELVSLSFVLIGGWVLIGGAAVALGGTESAMLGASFAAESPMRWLGPLLLPIFAVFAAYLVTVVAWIRGRVTRVLLGGASEDLGSELVELRQSRARLVDGFEVERRRIERDLHDGAQQRLLALHLNLGMAVMTLEDKAADEESIQLVRGAHDASREALSQLREVVRGIHPRVLTDRGLPAAVAELADRLPIPVDMRIDLPLRPPSFVEVATYFVIAEALTNVVRHSGASSATVTGGLHDATLAVEISDAGAGGADPGAGSGLQGLVDRVAAVGGRLMLASPIGGPTTLRLEIPCQPKLETTDGR
ncbi:sensor histidine kinase [Actinoalloteichus hymeniacidonis]|uniref:histidine kinase n=2 Tax=Actinoalloteichus hymeniacidonis TaxID=340345 RepID=A0AAC9HMS0_9PSEU|nr:sensor histidine kinase [Actinoalloteichus hymeniacidonis]AOS61700.1 signal transduction histidine kinase [Actinoalloteichus hymeniacidonis]